MVRMSTIAEAPIPCPKPQPSSTASLVQGLEQARILTRQAQLPHSFKAANKLDSSFNSTLNVGPLVMLFISFTATQNRPTHASRSHLACFHSSHHLIGAIRAR